jgi:Ni,Fe-hydrogenase maturation factor
VEAPRRKYDLPEDGRLLDGGTLGLDLLPMTEGIDGVLFADAVN